MDFENIAAYLLFGFCVIVGIGILYTVINDPGLYNRAYGMDLEGNPIVFDANYYNKNCHCEKYNFENPTFLEKTITTQHSKFTIRYPDRVNPEIYERITTETNLEWKLISTIEHTYDDSLEITSRQSYIRDIYGNRWTRGDEDPNTFYSYIADITENERLIDSYYSATDNCEICGGREINCYKGIDQGGDSFEFCTEIKLVDPRK